MAISDGLKQLALQEQRLRFIGAKELSISGSDHRAAIEACRTYGRIVVHPARLNLGDCFAYASARIADLPLLYKGNDFSQTDVESV